MFMMRQGRPSAATSQSGKPEALTSSGSRGPQGRAVFSAPEEENWILARGGRRKAVASRKITRGCVPVGLPGEGRADPVGACGAEV